MKKCLQWTTYRLLSLLWTNIISEHLTAPPDNHLGSEAYNKARAVSPAVRQLLQHELQGAGHSWYYTPISARAAAVNTDVNM